MPPNRFRHFDLRQPVRSGLELVEPAFAALLGAVIRRENSRLGYDRIQRSARLASISAVRILSVSSCLVFSEAYDFLQPSRSLLRRLYSRHNWPPATDDRRSSCLGRLCRLLQQNRWEFGFGFDLGRRLLRHRLHRNVRVSYGSKYSLLPANNLRRLPSFLVHSFIHSGIKTNSSYTTKNFTFGGAVHP